MYFLRSHVYLVKRKGTDKIFAMKAMKKTDVLNKNMVEQGMWFTDNLKRVLINIAAKERGLFKTRIHLKNYTCCYGLHSCYGLQYL